MLPTHWLKAAHLSPLQVRKAGETVVMAGMATAAVFGIVALAGAFFGSSKKEDKNTE